MKAVNRASGNWVANPEQSAFSKGRLGLVFDRLWALPTTLFCRPLLPFLHRLFDCVPLARPEVLPHLVFVELATQHVAERHDADGGFREPDLSEVVGQGAVG